MNKSLKTHALKRTKNNINLNSLYDKSLNDTIFTPTTLNLPKKDFTRSRIKKKRHRTWKTPIYSIPEESDEDNKGGKKKKRRKRYTRKRKN